MLALVAAALADPPVTAPPLDASLYPDLSARTEISVLVFGDSGVGEGFAPVAASAEKVCFAADRATPCDLALLLGDNVYEVGFVRPGGPAWKRAFAVPMAPFVPHAQGAARFRAWVVAGNHDWNQDMTLGGPRATAAIATSTAAANVHGLGALWQEPALAFTVPGLPSWLHLHGIDTQSIVQGHGDAMLDATRTAMQAEAGWKVSFGHHLPVSTGGHGAAPGDTMDETMQAALETLRPAGLDLVLAGHDHHQELLETGGVPVIIQGNSSKGRGGAEGPYVGCSRWRAVGDEARGFAILTFRPDALHVEFFDGTGASIHTADYARDAIPASGPKLGTCG
jgi:hypothetical protein